MATPHLFISYSHRDSEWKTTLMEQFGVLQQYGNIEPWDDQRIHAGHDWEERILQSLDTASAAVLLISAHFLGSEFIRQVEVPRLLQRARGEGLPIIPVLLEHCDWRAVEWLARMQLIPRNAQPLSAFSGPELQRELAAITRAIREELNGARQRSATPETLVHPPARLSTSHLPITGEFLFGRERELEQLDAAWGDPATHVLSLVAWGGVGKSSLVNHWLGRLARRGYAGARHIFAWSFYSQGTSEGLATGDAFIDAALRWFGDPHPQEGSAWDKGTRLAEWVQRERTLLILDGLEPLQAPPTKGDGQLRDQAVSALVRELAVDNPGLCLITSRYRVADLAPFARSTAPVLELEKLSAEAGASLLRAMGVLGSEQELRASSQEFEGHGLALNLLGTYLRDACGGDVKRRSEVQLLEEDAQQGGHARRVMRSYERWLGPGPHLEVLRLIGLFDRPAERRLIDVLREPPPLPGLTEGLSGIPEQEWRRVLSKLRRARLLAEEDRNAPDSIDAHPLVREYFGSRLREQFSSSWREGHRRLFEHLQRTTPTYPDSVEEILPLYVAIAHGSKAGRQKEAFEEIYRPRIARGIQFFGAKKLGLVGAELAALASFFESPWNRVAPGLSKQLRAEVLSLAGIRLSTQGRLREALQAFDASLSQSKGLPPEHSGESEILFNSTDALLFLGELEQARARGERALTVTARPSNSPVTPFFRVLARTRLGTVLHHQRKLQEALHLFVEAERIQRSAFPQYRYLYDVHGFDYCDLLLTLGRPDEALARARTWLGNPEHLNSLQGAAVTHLAAGRACTQQVVHSGASDFAEAMHHLDKAVELVRKADSQMFAPRVLLGRASTHRLRGAFAEAARDLQEALVIADRGDMRLYQADAYLEFARLHLAEDNKSEALENAQRARELISSMKYLLRQEELEQLEGALGPSAPSSFRRQT